MDFSSIIYILKSDDKEKLEALKLVGSATIETKGENGKLPLILSNSPPLISLSVYFHALKCFDYLQQSSDIFISDKMNRTIAHFCAAAGETKVLENIIKKSQELALRQDSEGNIPLHYAAMFGRTETCKLLINLGCSFDSVNNEKKKPIEIAALYGFSETVLFLGNEMKFAKHKNTWKDSVLESAIKSGSFETVKVIVETFLTKVKKQHTLLAASKDSVLIYSLLAKYYNCEIPVDIVKATIAKNEVLMYKAFLENNKTKLDYSLLTSASPTMILAALAYEEKSQKFNLETDIDGMKELLKRMKTGRDKGTLVESLFCKEGNTKLINKLIESEADFSKCRDILNNCAKNRTYRHYELLINDKNFMELDTEDNPVLLQCLNDTDGFYFFMKKGAKLTPQIIFKNSMIQKALSYDEPQNQIIKALLNKCSDNEENAAQMKKIVEKLITKAKKEDTLSLLLKYI